jgi:hypothetical protein
MIEGCVTMLGWPGSRRYGFVSLGLWGGFLAALLCLTWGQAQEWPVPALALIAVVPAVTVVFQFMLAWKTIAAQDEFVRGVTTKRLLVAAAGTLTLAVAWSPIQPLLGLPSLPVWLVYPLFWGMLGIVSSFVQDSRP